MGNQPRGSGVLQVRSAASAQFSSFMVAIAELEPHKTLMPVRVSSVACVGSRTDSEGTGASSQVSKQSALGLTPAGLSDDQARGQDNRAAVPYVAPESFEQQIRSFTPKHFGRLLNNR